VKYKTVEIEDYGLKIEVGIVPQESSSKFLSLLEIDGEVSKEVWESFLLDSLIKDKEPLAAVTNVLQSERDKVRFRSQLMDIIYNVNSKLKPYNIGIATKHNKLVHISDAIRKEIVYTALPANPGWFESINLASMVDKERVDTVVDNLWEHLKKKHGSDRDYVKQVVKVLDIELPVLDIESTDMTVDDLLEEFVNIRCDGDVAYAQTNYRYWIIHILAAFIPEGDSILYALAESGYMNVYTENIVMLQMYLAVLTVNPALDWDKLDWSNYKVEEPKKVPETKPNIRKPVNKQVIPKGKSRRSTKKEVEEETKKFTDVSYESLLSLKSRMLKRILGQDTAIETITDALSIARVGLRGEDSPIGCFLLPGPTGVGKTETAKVLAEELDVELIRVDCSEYQESHSVAKIFGSPPGYVGFEDYGRGMGPDYTPPSTVSSKLRENPFCVLLFDEIEKAHDSIFNVLLQIMDEARITSGRGDTIKFHDTIILLTSNIGTKEAEDICRKNMLGFGEDTRDFCGLGKETIEKAIEDKFKPEFRNRLSDTIIFGKLDKDVCNGIVNNLLNITKTNLEKAQHTTLTWDDDVCRLLTDLGYSEEFGGRELKRTVKQKVELPLAKHIMLNNYTSSDQNIKAGSKIVVFVNNEEIQFDLEGDHEKDTSKTKRLSNSKSPRPDEGGSRASSDTASSD
jgi:DNA polymerase III delta prime subunit